MIQTKFCKPHNIRLIYGSIFNEQGDLIDLKERGLDGVCEVNKKHNWLLLPQQQGQKEYVMCIHCTEFSHL